MAKSIILVDVTPIYHASSWREFHEQVHWNRCPHFSAFLCSSSSLIWLSLLLEEILDINISVRKRKLQGFPLAFKSWVTCSKNFFSVMIKIWKWRCILPRSHFDMKKRAAPTWWCWCDYLPPWKSFTQLLRWCCGNFDARPGNHCSFRLDEDATEVPIDITLLSVKLVNLAFDFLRTFFKIIFQNNFSNPHPPPSQEIDSFRCVKYSPYFPIWACRHCTFLGMQNWLCGDPNA